MLARGQRAEQIAREGLRIEGLSTFTVPVTTITDASRLGSTEVLIVATKALGTAQALAPLRSAEIGCALSVQNGVMKNEILADAFGTERVLGALANTSGELLASGSVLFTRNVNLFVGEPAGHLSERAKGVAQRLDAAGVRSAAVTGITNHEWSKFVGWVAFAVLAVTTRVVSWKFLADPDGSLLFARIVRELGRLAAACKVELSDESMIPVVTLCRVSEAEAAAMIVRLGEEYRATAPGHRLSTLQDLDAGRALEVDETIGYAARKASELGLDLPLLQTAWHLLAAIDRVRR
jgi:2-dehydropantoate 2-reductase